MISSDSIVLAEYKRGGMHVRTARDLKALITDLILNSGEEIALWAEGEAKRCADIWREPEAPADPEESDGEGAGE